MFHYKLMQCRHSSSYSFVATNLFQSILVEIVQMLYKIYHHEIYNYTIDGLVQDCGISITNTLERLFAFHLALIKPSQWSGCCEYIHVDEALQWCHNERDGISNHQPYECLLNHLFRHRSKKTSKPHVTGLCEENSPMTSEFPPERASNAVNVSIWWHHHGVVILVCWKPQFTVAITCAWNQS